VAVCLLPGTELAFENEVKRDVGMVFGWKLGHSVAKFQHVNQDRPNVHHDALEFPDGKTVLLTQLCEGQRATVLQLPACLPVTVDEAQRHHRSDRVRKTVTPEPHPPHTCSGLLKR